jgi:hypothetical protein
MRTDDVTTRIPAQSESSAPEVLAGLVERVTYHNVENGFCVLRAKARGHQDVVTVIGHAATIAAGEWITASGEWVNPRPAVQGEIPTHRHGVGTARAVRVFKTYGSYAVQVMTENPYRLAGDIRGIGFKTAEAIAMKLGIEKTAMVRVRAGISYALTEAMDEGHCGLPADELVPLAEKLLEVPQELVRTDLDLELSKVASVDQRMRLECGVCFRQLRTCRRTRPGQLCAITGSRRASLNHLVGDGSCTRSKRRRLSRRTHEAVIPRAIRPCGSLSPSSPSFPARETSLHALAKR